MYEALSDITPSIAIRIACPFKNIIIPVPFRTRVARRLTTPPVKHKSVTAYPKKRTSLMNHYKINVRRR